MNKSSLGTILGITIPLACAIILGMMCFGQFRERELAKEAERQEKSNVDSLLRIRDTISAEPLTTKHLAAQATPDEQAQFLTQLRMNAQSSGIKLVEYRNLGQVSTRRPDPNQKQNQSQSLYRPVASTLTVQGQYDGVRAFAYSLLRADRLMNMNGVTWKRDPDGRTTTLSFTLIRYVTDPSTFVETTTVPMKDKGSAGGASA